MNPRKIAISLGIVAAIAALFALVFVPFTASEKERIAGYLKETNNCKMFTDRAKQLDKEPLGYVEEKVARYHLVLEQDDCLWYLDFYSTWSSAAYLLFKSPAGFVIVFALTFLLPALFQRYWRWLNT